MSSAIYSASRDEVLPRQDPAVTVPMHVVLFFFYLYLSAHGKVTAIAGQPPFATG